MPPSFTFVPGRSRLLAGALIARISRPARSHWRRRSAGMVAGDRDRGLRKPGPQPARAGWWSGAGIARVELQADGNAAWSTATDACTKPD